MARARKHRKPATTAPTLAVTPVRLLIGALFMGHGLQKLRGWFGGGGIEDTAEMMESVGLVPAKPAAFTGGLTETAGGALMATGCHTPIAAAMITGAMATAIDKVHRLNGPWNQDRGYEYNLVLIAAVAAIAGVGPGPISLDARRGRYRTGIGWSIAAVAAGFAGARLVAQLATMEQEVERAVDTEFGLPEEPVDTTPAHEEYREYERRSA